MTAHSGKNHSSRATRHSPPVIGLIGGIGSGKSRVAGEFANQGAVVISGDQLGHEALRQPALRDQVVARWGREILNEREEIDRSKLGAIVFSDLKELRALESIVFPYIGRRLEEEVKTAKGNPATRFIVIDAAVMLEAGWNRFCDRLLFVDVPRSVRLERLARQRGWTEKEVAAREDAQLSLKEKASRADAVVNNSGSAEQLALQIRNLLRGWGCS